MTRKMYDSTNARDCPPDGDLYLGYADGSYAWSADDWAYWESRGKRVVRAAIRNDRLDAQVIDIEPGNNDAHGAVPWIALKWARSETPTVYCFSDRGPAGYRISDVRAACDADKVRRPLFLIADFDNDPSTFDPAGDPQIVGKQYANDVLTGGHYDASIVADHWPGVDKEDSVDARIPSYVGQSVETIVLAAGNVATASGIWHYPTHGGDRTIALKCAGYTPGVRVVTLYPPADPDADPTLVTDAQPAYFLVTTRAV